MANDLIPQPEEIRAIEVMAKNAVESKYFDKLGGYAGLFSIAMYARELKLPIMHCLFGGMQSIQGKIQISPQLMNSLIRQGGHRLDIDSNDQRCIIKGTRKDSGETCVVTFSVEDAKRAGIFKPGGGWDKYPSDMCFARALSRLARRLFPDVIGMSYVEGEFEDDKAKTEPKEPEKKFKEEVVEAEVVEEPKINQSQIDQILDMVGNNKEVFKRLLVWQQVTECKDIKAENFDSVIDTLKRKMESLKKEEVAE